MNKIVITTTTFGEYNKEPLKMLKKNNFEIVLNPYGRKLKKDEIIKFSKDAVGIIAGTENLDAPILKQLPRLKVISRCGTGIDNIDLKVATKLGIEVFNTPDAATLAVAELTVGLILNLLRKINLADTSIKNGKWEKLMGNLLCGKRIGIIGFGRIGKKLAELLKPFGCQIAYFDPFVENGILGLTRLSKENLLKWADIISIHASTKDRILGEKELNLIKKGAWLINVSRGGLIDEKVLYGHLKKGCLCGAAIDVFKEEPYRGPLKNLNNVILTSHIGSYAKEARINMETQAVENLLKGIKEVDKIK